MFMVTVLYFDIVAVLFFFFDFLLLWMLSFLGVLNLRHYERAMCSLPLLLFFFSFFSSLSFFSFSCFLGFRTFCVVVAFDWLLDVVPEL